MVSDILSADERRAVDISRGKIQCDDVYRCSECGATHEVISEAEAARMSATQCPICGHIGFELMGAR